MKWRSLKLPHLRASALRRYRFVLGYLIKPLLPFSGSPEVEEPLLPLVLSSTEPEPPVAEPGVTP